MGLGARTAEGVLQLEQAKLKLVVGEEPAGDVVRERILTSWRRSRLWGVAPDVLDPPYDEDVEVDSLLVRAARPVLDRLDAALAGTAMSVLLTDRHGRVLERRVSDASLARHLDHIHLAAGFSYSEEHVGTNGIGSAIESREPFFVAGAEHFVHPLAGVSCAGAPIVHPLTGRLEGVIDLTCRAADATPLMAVLASEAAADVRSEILDHVSGAERALLRAFLAANRHAGRAVVAISGDLIMTNGAAATLLERADHVALGERATELLRQGRSHGEMLFSSGARARLRLDTVEGAAGVVVEVNLAPPQRSEPAGSAVTPPAPSRSELAGSSGAWAATWARVERCCHSGDRLLLNGEAGTGKLALLTAAHHSWRQCRPLDVLDVAELGAEDVLAHLARTPESHGTVLLRHLDSADLRSLAEILRSVSTLRRASVWVAATSTTRAEGSSAPTPEVASFFDQIVSVPPLRYRIEDLRDLVPALLARRRGQDRVRVEPAALQALLRYPWPGNVAELDGVLATVLERRPSGPIRVEDLPGSVLCTRKRVLSELEAMERDMIVKALLDCEGDKALAASRLGISRATIYRKIRSYGILLDPEQNQG